MAKLAMSHILNWERSSFHLALMKIAIILNLLFVSALCGLNESKHPFQSIKYTIGNTPVQQGKQTLVLDLDETLIHSTFSKRNAAVPKGGFRVDCDWDSYDVKLRPGLETFLKELAKVYELVLYTAGTRDYAEPIIKHIDPNNLFKFKFYKDACLDTFWGPLKSLKQLKARNKDTFAIDDRGRFGSKKSVILIPAYWGAEGDDVLVHLLPKLLDGPLSHEKIKRINKDYIHASKSYY